jgi:hypothetical protein
MWRITYVSSKLNGYDRDERHETAMHEHSAPISLHDRNR